MLEVDGPRCRPGRRAPLGAVGPGRPAWAACARARLAPGPTDDVVVRGDEAFRPAACGCGPARPVLGIRFQRLDPVPLTTTRPPTSPARRSPAARLLALAMNSDAGWQATLDVPRCRRWSSTGSARLRAPDGAGGTVDVTFSPDAPTASPSASGSCWRSCCYSRPCCPTARGGRTSRPASPARTPLPAGGGRHAAVRAGRCGPWAALTAGLVLAGFACGARLPTGPWRWRSSSIGPPVCWSRPPAGGPHSAVG